MKTWKKILLLELCLVLVLTACANEDEVDYSIEGTQEVQEEQEYGGKKGLEQFVGEENWKASWEVNEGETIQVSAPIILPNVKQMSVLEVEEAQFDEGYKKRVAQNIFDAGEVYYGDAAHLPKMDLNTNYFNSIETYNGKLINLDVVIKESKEYAEACEQYENATEAYVPAESYSVNRYIGNYEEKLFTLVFTEDSETLNFRGRKQIYWTVKNIYEVCPEEYKEVEPLDCSPWKEGGDWGENLCKLSEEEALKEALQFVERLGLDYNVVSHRYPLLWGNPPETVTEFSNSDSWGVNGYVFFLDFGIDNLSFVDYGTEADYRVLWSQESKNAELKYSLESRLQVYVTDNGVIRAIVDNPVDLISVKDGVELLPLETIKEIMQEKTAEHWESISDGTMSSAYLDAMELIYFRVSDTEDTAKYSYIPAWRLANVTRDTVRDEINIGSVLLINAIDGTYIDIYNEMQ